jgi:hypothetical protein
MYESKKDKNNKDYSLGLHGAAMNGNVGKNLKKIHQVLDYMDSFI